MHRQFPECLHRPVHYRQVNLWCILHPAVIPVNITFPGSTFSPSSVIFSSGAAAAIVRVKIPIRVLWVELGTGLLVAFLFWRFGWQPELAVSIVYCSVLIVLGVIDFYHQLILNKIVYSVAIVAVILNIFLPQFGLHSFLFGLLGGAVGFLILFIWSCH